MTEAVDLRRGHDISMEFISLRLTVTTTYLPFHHPLPFTLFNLRESTASSSTHHVISHAQHRLHVVKGPRSAMLHV